MYPQNPEILQGIYKANFFENFTSGQKARIYPGLVKDIAQEVTTVTYTSFGSVPEPRQLSGTAASAGIPAAKNVKDYKLVASVVEHEVKLAMPRSVAEDNPQDASGFVSKLGGKASFYYDRIFFGLLASSTLLGYDGKVLYSTTHGESGASQDNAHTAAGTPTVAQVESSITTNLAGLMAYTDDQGTPVNEGVSSFTILVNPIQYFTYQTALNPNMSNQAVDSSGGTGKFRGLFTVISSSLVPSKTHYIFANGGEPAVARCHKTEWDLKSNMFTDSDIWNNSHTAMFTGYARFAMYPWQWKSTVRFVHS